MFMDGVVMKRMASLVFLLILCCSNWKRVALSQSVLCSVFCTWTASELLLSCCLALLLIIADEDFKTSKSVKYTYVADAQRSLITLCIYVIQPTVSMHCVFIICTYCSVRMILLWLTVNTAKYLQKLNRHQIN